MAAHSSPAQLPAFGAQGKYVEELRIMCQPVRLGIESRIDLQVGV